MVQLMGMRIMGFMHDVIVMLTYAPTVRIGTLQAEIERGRVQEQPAAIACNRIGRLHYVRGIRFTADNWMLVKRAITDVVLEENNIVRFVKEFLDST